MSSPFSIRCAVALMLWFALASSSGVQAAPTFNETGVRLLQAQLPAGARIPETECEPLARAVGRATLAHRDDAPAILAAALSAGVRKDRRRYELDRPCPCVIRIYHAALNAAPSQASALLDIAIAFHPDCADALAAALYDSADDNLSFGAGFGPGFPGAPGGIGSPASGGVALPTPVPETAVVNG